MSTSALLNLGLSLAQATFLPVTLKPYRALNGITADAVVREEHNDELILTEHPVEEGALVTDHAYKLPAQLTVVYGWSEGSDQNNDDPEFLRNLYNQLLQLQRARTVFDVYTGKRHYTNMLLKSLRADTDQTTERVLMVRMICQEVLFAKTQLAKTTATGVTANTSDPKNTAPIVNQGTKQLQPGSSFNAGGGK